MEEGVAAGGVELAENIVQEIDRPFITAGMEEGALGELEGEGDRALLAFAGEVRGGHAVQADRDVIAMRADDGLAGGDFPIPCLEDGIRERRSGGGEVGEGEGLGAGGDCELGGRCERGEGGDEIGAAFGDEGAVLDENFLIGSEFGGADGWLPEKEIFGTEGAAVAGVCGAVFRIKLGSEEIQEVAAIFARAADEGEVFISDPNDQTAIGEVFGAGSARAAAGLHGEGSGAVDDFTIEAPRIGGDAEAGSVKFREGIEAVGAGGLEADEGADGFEEGGFPLGVIAKNNEAGGRGIEGEGIEAAEILEAEMAEHAGPEGGIRVLSGGDCRQMIEGLLVG